MTQKPTKKTFFLLLLFSVNFFIFPTVALADSKTISWNSATIDKTWLVATTSTATDTISGDGSGRFATAIGGKKLTDFQKIGTLEKEGQKVAWRAKATFEFSVLAYTKVMPSDTVSGQLQKKNTFQWLLIRKYGSKDILGNYQNLEEKKAFIEYNEVDIGSEMFSHHYAGHIPINLEVKQDFAGRSFNINGYTIKNLNIYSEIRDVVVIDAQEGYIAEYKDLFSGKQEVTKESGGVEVLDPDLGDGKKSSEVLTKLSSLGLSGREDLGESTMVKGNRDGQAKTVAEAIGTTWSNPQSSESYKFNMRYEVKPAITVTKEEVTYDYGEIDWDYKDQPFSASSVKLIYSQKRDFKRINSVHVYNKMIMNSYKVEVNLIAEGELEGELGGDELEDPAVEIGDFIWDEDFTGTTEMTVTDYDNPILNWFRGLGKVGAVLLITVIIIAIIALVVYLLLKSLGIAILKGTIKDMIGGN